jgi:uncharacterized integral membrane protein
MRLISWGSLILAIFLLVSAGLNATPEKIYLVFGLATAALVFVIIAIATSGISLYSYFWKQKDKNKGG